MQQTEVGIAVNKLRSNPNPKIASLAKEVVKRWKSDVDSSNKSSGSSEGTPKKAANASSAPPKAMSASSDRDLKVSPVTPNSQKTQGTFDLYKC
jgi:transcription elongation factor S-II